MYCNTLDQLDAKRGERIRLHGVQGSRDQLAILPNDVINELQRLRACLGEDAKYLEVTLEQSQMSMHTTKHTDVEGKETLQVTTSHEIEGYGKVAEHPDYYISGLLVRDAAPPGVLATLEQVISRSTKFTDPTSGEAHEIPGKPRMNEGEAYFDLTEAQQLLSRLPPLGRGKAPTG